MIEISGPPQKQPSLTWDRSSSCWRTCQGSFLEMQDGQPMGARWSESFPSWGTTVSGELWEQGMLAHPTSESGGGALPWPTPDAGLQGRGRTPQDALIPMVQHWDWPTPVADDTGTREKPYVQGGTPLSLAVTANWPTPEAYNYPKSGGSTPGQASYKEGSQIHLHHAATSWATPQSRDYRSAEGNDPRWENPDRSRNLNDQVRTEGDMWMTPNTMDTLPAKTQEALNHEYTHRPGTKNPNNLRDQVNVEEGQAMWPTPSAQGSAGEINEDLVRRGQKLVNSKTGRVLQTNLATEARQATWPTPNVVDHKGFDPPGKKNPHRPGELYEVENWATPTTRDWKDQSDPSPLVPTNWLLGRQAPRTETAGQDSSPSVQNSPRPSPKRLNPNFVEHLMGLPIGWTALIALKPSEMDRFLKLSRNFSDESSWDKE